MFMGKSYTFSDINNHYIYNMLAIKDGMLDP